MSNIKNTLTMLLRKDDLNEALVYVNKNKTEMKKIFLSAYDFIKFSGAPIALFNKYTADYYVKICIAADLFTEEDINIFQSNKYLRSAMMEEVRLNKIIIKKSFLNLDPFSFIASDIGIDKSENKKFLLKNPSRVISSLDLEVGVNHLVTKNIFSLAEEKSDISKSKTSLESILYEKEAYFLNMIALRNFPTMYQYMNDLMTDGNIGYYATGKIKFNDHYSTYSSDCRSVANLAESFSNQLLHTWKSLLSEGKIKKEEEFIVVECGAGDGNLCLHIVKFLALQAMKSPEWKEFHEVISYKIIEISPALARTQSEKLNDFKKVEIFNADACDIDKVIGREKVGAIISNELLDMLLPELLNFENGILTRKMPVFFIHEDNVNLLLKRAKEKEGINISTSYINKIRDQSKIYFKILQKMSKPDDMIQQIDPKKIPKIFWLSHKDFMFLNRFSLEKDEIFAANHMIFIHSPASKEILNYIRNNGGCSLFNDIEKSTVIELKIDSFIKAASKALISGGEMMSIDYGDASYTSDYGVKTITNYGLGYDLFKEPGYVDITHDVDFKQVAASGEKYGLQSTFFGKQEQINFIKVRNKENFWVLLQKKQNNNDLNKEEKSDRFQGSSHTVTPFQFFKKNVKESFDDYHTIAKNYFNNFVGCHSSYKPFIDAIKNKNYSYAMRLACRVGNETLITSLIKVHECIRFDINETSSNGKTAYDWLLLKRYEYIEQGKQHTEKVKSLDNILKILEYHGGRSSDRMAPTMKRA